MSTKNTLTSLPEGQEAVIAEVGSRITGPQRRRLLDLGLVPGVTVRHRMDGPGGDPRAYEILESVIALRKDQTDHIYIESTGG